MAKTGAEDGRVDNDRLSLNTTVKALGAVSLFTDLSSEMVYPINPVFITKVLGAPAWVIGLTEGLAESAASLLKLYSGQLSDRLGRRKPITVWGYGMAALSKPLIGLAGVWPLVLGARVLDRVGKGLRAAPRDAMIADTTPPSMRGRAFGLHRSLDTAGAVLGPLVGFCFLEIYGGSLRNLYFLALLPALISVAILLVFVKERVRAVPAGVTKRAFSFKSLDPGYRRYLVLVGLFSLGNSSDAFLLLKAQSMGVAPERMLLLYALFNVVEASLGYLAGNLSDRVGRQPLIVAGWFVFALVYLGFALLNGPVAATFLFLAYGLYYTLTQGSQKAMASDLAKPEHRGAQLGAFHMLVGIAALPASLFAGFLFSRVGPSAPFYVGSATAALSAVLLLASGTPRGPSGRRGGRTRASRVTESGRLTEFTR